MSTEHDRHLEEPLPHDELDALLRIWHEESAERAMAGRAQALARLRSEGAAVEAMRSMPAFAGVAGATRSGAWRVLHAAASFALLITALALLIPLNSRPAMARQEVILVPDGGRLEARDARGGVIGPCALKHTDVQADIAGPFSRVTVKQQYHNPYPHKIEAVYTFPLSHRAAVDRMTMTIGDRIVEGEVKERQQARQMYESARSAGQVASLLEQERPNIFTQSVANIEPNADVLIEISYVEMLQQRDGEYTFDFPMVVAPRYIPGSPVASQGDERRINGGNLPNELERRDGGAGLILLGPATFERQKITMQGAVEQGNLQMQQTPIGPAPFIQRFIDAATPILPPDGAFRLREDVQALYRANPNYDFHVLYADGSREFGQIAGDGLGHVNGRWFYFDPAMFAAVQREEASDAEAFAADTNQVPDASRITPMPVRPPTRAGHDISLSVHIDTGEAGAGPAIIDYNSDLHEIVRTDGPQYGNLGNTINLALKDQREIPNRDFVLRWRCIDDAIREAVFTHADAKWVDAPDNKGGGFLTAVIAPPAKVAPEQILPRELVFVLDTSGSMEGLPIDKAKAVMSKAIEAMRPGDTFNLITFAGDTRILWKTPRPNSDANRAEAQAFLSGQNGAGGTEMMTAINAALTPTSDEAMRQAGGLTAAQLAELPADGREIVVRTRLDDIEAVVMKSAVMQPSLRVRPDLALKTTSFHLPVEQMGGNPLVELRGKWSTINGERTLEVSAAARVEEGQGGRIDPMRIVMFLTDGQVGNDDAIIAAVRANSKTTRVFSFGIGDSPNRYLLDGIAQAGRGEATYVNLNNDPDAAVQAFARRIESPVLRDISVTFSDGLDVFDVMPAPDSPGGIPDLWDVKPLIVHGRYSSAKPQSGKITIKGKTAQGEYVRVIDVALPDHEKGHAMLPALWARAKIDDVLSRDENIRRQGVVEYASEDSKKQIIALGERYGITSAFTSFVAIEKTRITVAGQPMLVPIPIEFPSGMNWEGVFGGDATHRPADDLTRALLGEVRKLDHEQSIRLLQLDEARRDTAALSAVAQQARVALVEELARVNPSLLELRTAGTTGDAQKKTQAELNSPGVNFANAPKLDLDGALSQDQLDNEGESDGYGATLGRNTVTRSEFTLDQGQLPDTNQALPQNGVRYAYTPSELYFALGQQQELGQVAQSSVERLGIEGQSLQAVIPQFNAQSTYIARGDQLSINSAGRQLGRDPMTGRLVPTDSGGGGGGGFGGGGGGKAVGGGSGGSIFGEAGGDPQRLSPEESGETLIDVVSENVNPEVWDFNGGDLATASLDNGVLSFRTLKDVPEAQTAIDRARGFVSMLTVAIPEVTELAKADAPPSKPFDPVKDIAQPRDDAPAGAAERDLPPQMVLFIYDVRDVITAIEQGGGTNAVDHLIEVITELIAPEYWDVNGGEWGRIQTLKGNLIITIGPEQHRQIEVLLKKIRTALAARNPDMKPADAPVFKGLGNVEPPAAAAATRAAEDPGIEVYDVHDMVAAAMNAQPPTTRNDALQAVFTTIQENIDPEGWRDLGGDTGSIHEVADLLVIRNTAANHRLIKGLLSQMDAAERRKEGDGAKPQAEPDDDAQDQARRKADADAHAVISSLQREDRLRRVIDDRLRLRIDEVNGAIVAKMLDETDRAAIVALVNDADDAGMLAKLKSLGVRVDDRNAALRLVAGEIDDVRRLVDVALLEGVRRIEPVMANK